MGKKTKSSRKGKKAWRANISTEDIENFFEKSTKDALSGGNVSSLPSDDLFYVDKSKDLSVKRKIEKKRDKVLRTDSMLQKNPFVQAVLSSHSKPKKKSKKTQKRVPAYDAQAAPKKDSASDSERFDIWANEGECKGKSRKVSKSSSAIPAVEVEPPGCSYNPLKEFHQDSLAQAVAEELKKSLRNELGPEPVPLTVAGEAIEEEDKYFLDVDDDESDEEGSEEHLNKDEDDLVQKRSVKEKRKTRAEFNRKARRKEHERDEAEAKKVVQVSQEIDCLPNILQEIVEEDEEKKKRHLRRVVAKQERLRTCPPKLGKYKFQPPPRQVLLTEEITGSIRKLKACCTLARDRYKSLEKRGLIVPTAKSGRK